MSSFSVAPSAWLALTFSHFELGTGSRLEADWKQIGRVPLQVLRWEPFKHDDPLDGEAGLAWAMAKLEHGCAVPGVCFAGGAQLANGCPGGQSATARSSKSLQVI